MIVQCLYEAYKHYIIIILKHFFLVLDKIYANI